MRAPRSTIHVLALAAVLLLAGAGEVGAVAPPATARSRSRSRGHHGGASAAAVAARQAEKAAGVAGALGGERRDLPPILDSLGAPRTADGLPTAPSVRTLEQEGLQFTQPWRDAQSLLQGWRGQDFASARVELTLSSAFDDWQNEDPQLDRAKRVMRDLYSRFYRDRFSELFGVQEWEDRLGSAVLPLGGSHGGGPSPWGLRLSPQVDYGGQVQVGASFRLPHAPNRLLAHSSLQIEQATGSGATSLVLKLDDGPRYARLEAVHGDPRTGDRYTLLLRFAF